jgi:hypothetical protein
MNATVQFVVRMSMSILSGMLQRIRRVEPQSRYRLRLSFADELEGIIDFTSFIQKGSVLSPNA